MKKALFAFLLLIGCKAEKKPAPVYVYKGIGRVEHVVFYEVRDSMNPKWLPGNYYHPDTFANKANQRYDYR